MRNISSERYGHVIPTTGFPPWCEQQNLPHDVENEMFPTKRLFTRTKCLVHQNQLLLAHLLSINCTSTSFLPNSTCKNSPKLELLCCTQLQPIDNIYVLTHYLSIFENNQQICLWIDNINGWAGTQSMS